MRESIGRQRRTIFGAFLCLWSALLVVSVRPVIAQTPPSLTAQENAKPGTTAWRLTNPAINREIEGYASRTSVNRGDSAGIDFYVNTGEPNFTYDIYRMGWYNGNGGRLVYSSPAPVPGRQQTLPLPDPATGLIECNWVKSFSLVIPSNPNDPTEWMSGVYLVKLTAGLSHAQSYIVFVVREDSRSSNLLFQSSVTTFQAYNTWGGKSVYDYLSPAGRAYKVSFNRPYDMKTAASGLEYGMGASEFLIGGDGGPPAGWEYCMLRFLEREGYDVTYSTDVDTHENGNLLLSHKTFLIVGHDEYWTRQMRENVTAARDQGVNIGVFAANVCYWQIRLEPSAATQQPNRTVVCYKYTPYDYSPELSNSNTADPYAQDNDLTNDNDVTVRWRDSLPNSNRIALPEEMFLGTQYIYEADNVNADMIISNGSHWIFSNTPIQTGSALANLVGYEADAMHGSSPAGTIALGASPTYKGNSHMTIYTAQSGAHVLATGSIKFAYGLDDFGVYDPLTSPDLRPSFLIPSVQQMTRNFLDRPKDPPAPDNTPPTVTSVLPASGATNIDPTRSVQVVFSESMTPATVSTATVKLFELNPDQTIKGTVLATVAYDALLKSAVLDPSSDLNPSTLYRATVTGGSAGAKDLSGNALANNYAWTFTTAAPARYKSLWSATATPIIASLLDDTNSVELGVKFWSEQDGSIAGIRFFKGTHNTGAHVGRLWSSTGQLLAQATFTSETGSGWQEVLFSNPIPVTAYTIYVASYHADNGGYAVDSGYFTSSSRDNAPLHAPISGGASGGNGVFLYGSAGFPTETYNGGNFWVDVLFEATAAPPDTTPPTVTVAAPANGAATVDPTVNVTVSFSELMDPATLTSNTIQLRDGSNNVIPATVAYDPFKRMATLDPTANLPEGATVQGIVQGGGAGVKDRVGNALAVAYTWSFTIAAPSRYKSIWTKSTLPSIASVGNDSNALELGVKFWPETNGSISGLRFYKGQNNTGTHVGRLWSSTGQLLGQVTFTGETAVGWQEAFLSNPVPVTANTLYVASYHTDTGGYAFDGNYFTSASRDNAPLHAPASGQVNGNGVFLYGSGGFPTGTYNGGNYWADVVFQDTVPPNVVSVWPLANSTDAVSNTSVTATFNEAIDPTTVTGATFQLKDGATTLSATVTYDATTKTARLVPNQALAYTRSYTASLLTGIKDASGNALASAYNWSFTTAAQDSVPPTVTATSPGNGANITANAVVTFNESMDPATLNTTTFTLKDAQGTTVPVTVLYNPSQARVVTLDPQNNLSPLGDYTVTIKGGASGVKDLSGNALAANASFSFTTAATLWGPTATPQIASADDSNPVELGVKFKSDISGYIAGIRFYKGTNNTGTHTGSLWTLSGQLLARATFTNESATGWQEVRFSAPVPITAGTVYVASYHTDFGGYSVNGGYFNSGVDTVPLHALSTLAAGGNGIYNYGPSSFPNQTYNAGNYWVDVVLMK